MTLDDLARAIAAAHAPLDRITHGDRVAARAVVLALADDLDLALSRDRDLGAVARLDALIAEARKEEG